MYMTSTNPQRYRFHLLEATSDECVVLRIYFSGPESLAIYYQDNYIPPTNAYWEGEKQLLAPHHIKWKPVPANTSAGNSL